MRCLPFPLLLLAFLAEDCFACVFDALALVRLWSTIFADFGSHLTDALLVDTRDHDFRGLWHLDFDALWHGIVHIMAVAKIELKHLAIESSAVTHAVDFKRLRETFGHTLDHVLHHGARHAPGGTGKLALILWIDLDCALFHLDVHLLVQDELELAL